MKKIVGKLHIDAFQCTVTMYNHETFYNRLQEASLVVIDGGVLSGQSNALGISKETWIRKFLGATPFVIMPQGEMCKTRTCFQLLLETFFTYKLSRKDKVIVIGGGALCDSASYVASVYMRGLHLSLVPSSLLSMVDASIGGKTAINFQHLKNMVGTFYLASEIIIFPDLLMSLEVQELKDGLAETVKAGFLYDEEILNIVERSGALYKKDFATNKVAWIDLIVRAIKVKLHFVQQDLYEKNIRAFLNLGHTFAHAHEACAKILGKKITHGEAVGLGIRAAMELGLRIKDAQGIALTDYDYATRVRRILDTLEYPKSYKGYACSTLIEKMFMDKKRVDNDIRFIVQKKQGDTCITAVKQETIMEVLQYLGGE